MIKLDVAAYCQNCPEFEPLVEQDTKGLLYDRSLIVDTTIKCMHRDRCRSMWLYLETVMRKEK